MAVSSFTVAAALVGPLFLLASTMLLGQEAEGEWGKRIFEQNTEANRRVVVDERYGKERRHPDYVWRFLESGKEGGEILYVHPSNFRVGTQPVLEPIEVLYANLVDDALFTVFNQRGRCWAMLLRKLPNGVMIGRPEAAPHSIPGRGMVDSSIGAPMASAAVKIGSGGEILLTVRDHNETGHAFELAAWRDDAKEEKTYYWKPVQEPATRP